LARAKRILQSTGEFLAPADLLFVCVVYHNAGNIVASPIPLQVQIHPPAHLVVHLITVLACPNTAFAIPPHCLPFPPSCSLFK
jgi:hypothetical protein